MYKPQLSGTEYLVLSLVALVNIVAFILFYTDMPAFLWYTEEDRLVELLTVFGLFLGSFVCLSRFFKLLKKRNWWFLTITLLLGIMLFFAAGEEMSWGQRIFGIHSSEYFKANNSQGETNLHNLVVYGVKLNKLIFTFLLGAAMGIYLLVVPLVYSKNTTIKKFVDYNGVPVASLYQIIAFGIMAALSTLLKHEKNAELLECGAALIFFLIVRYPKNIEIFDASR